MTRTSRGSPRPSRRAACRAARRQVVVDAAREGFFAGFNEILLIGGGLALAGAVAAVLLVRPQDMRSEPAPAAAAA